MMRPNERRNSGQTDQLRAQLDQIVGMGHSLPKLARAWTCQTFQIQVFLTCRRAS
jgi:hypothetical protein